MKKLFALVFAAILLGGCIKLEDPSVEQKVLATATVASSVCPICPTCEALVPTVVPVTGTPTVIPTNTSIPVPPTPTIAIVTPTVTLPPTKTLTPTLVPYKLQSTNPTFTQNFNHPDLGCNWMGVAGQVFDKAGKPVAGIVVTVKGTLPGGEVNQVALTQMQIGQNYGPAGYEITLANAPVMTTNALTIQLFDLSANPLSKPIAFSTSELCTQNLILINFVTTP